MSKLSLSPGEVNCPVKETVLWMFKHSMPSGCFPGGPRGHREARGWCESVAGGG